MSRNRSLWLHVRGQQCIPVSDVDLAHELSSGTLPSDALVWIPGQRCWVRADTLPGYRSPDQKFDAAEPAPLEAGCRIPPAVVAADPARWVAQNDEDATAAPVLAAAREAVPEALDDTEVRLPRVVLSRPSLPEQVGATLVAANSPGPA